MADVFFDQLRSRVVQPALACLGLDQPAAINLVLGTAAHETGGRYLAQWPAGPALGFWQIEPETHHDLLQNSFGKRPDLARRLNALLVPDQDPDFQLVGNLAYAAAVCRLLYWRAKPPLPPATDLKALSAYWKEHFNTPCGAGSAAEWESNYRSHIGDPQ